MAVTNPNDVRMSLGEHLDELRKRIFLGLIGPVAAGIVLLFYATDLIGIVCQPLRSALEAANQPTEIITREVGAAFAVYLRVSLIGGLIIGIPWLGYQLWLFVAPALYPGERKFAVYLMPFSALLAMIGVTFMYFVALPFTLWFLIGFANWYTIPENVGRSPIEELIQPERPEVTGELGLAPYQLPRLLENPADAPEGSIWIKVPENRVYIMLEGHARRLRLEGLGMVTQQQDLGEYISFVMFLALAFAISFQLPLVMLALGYMNVLDYKTMRRGWRFMALGCAIVGALLTPPDIASMIALGLPMYALYEFGLLLVRLLAPGKGAKPGEGDGADGAGGAAADNAEPIDR